MRNSKWETTISSWITTVWSGRHSMGQNYIIRQIQDNDTTPTIVSIHISRTFSKGKDETFSVLYMIIQCSQILLLLIKIINILIILCLNSYFIISLNITDY
jgi:hypothetical protein